MLEVFSLSNIFSIGGSLIPFIEQMPRGQGRAPPAGPRGSWQAPAYGTWVVPQVALWSSGVFRRIKNPRKFPSHSDDISCGGLSEIQKQQKQETSTRHLVNGLVQQNA